MKPLILSFFAALLVYSLFFDDEKGSGDYRFGVEHSLDYEQDSMSHEGLKIKDAELGMEKGQYPMPADSVYQLPNARLRVAKF